jgi:hypothetical protein
MISRSAAKKAKEKSVISVFNLTADSRFYIICRQEVPFRL